MAELTAARPEVSGLPLVLKFGGSSFAELDGYARVARYAAHRVREEGRPLVVVVSAMSGTTGALQQLLHEVSPDPPANAAAMLLTAGETVSVALLAAALNAEGIPACPLTAEGTGLLGDGRADRARLVRADPGVLCAALENWPVLVVPGGQAADSAGRTVMLGRNSSDLSAVALAGALGATGCELFSDVPGVCTADPHLVPAARTLERISYAGVRRMARYGAKVVQDSAVDWAERTGVLLHCRPLPWTAGAGESRGTVVGAGPAAAVVVVHGSDEVWDFPAGHERHVAVEKLRSQGCPSTTVDFGGVHYLVVRPEGRVVVRLSGAGRRHDELCLITTIGRDGAASHTLVPAAEADAEAIRRHEVLYPGPPRPAGPSAPAKARSAHSTVLAGRATPVARAAPVTGERKPSEG